MKPFKTAVPFAKFLLRLALIAFIYKFYYDIFATFKFNSVLYFISFAMVLFGVLLLLGTFFKNNTLTVLSGLLIFLISVYMTFTGGFSFDNLLIQIVPISIGFYFFARGNVG